MAISSLGNFRNSKMNPPPLVLLRSPVARLAGMNVPMSLCAFCWSPVGFSTRLPVGTRVIHPIRLVLSGPGGLSKEPNSYFVLVAVLPGLCLPTPGVRRCPCVQWARCAFRGDYSNTASILHQQAVLLLHGQPAPGAATGRSLGLHP